MSLRRHARAIALAAGALVLTVLPLGGVAQAAVTCSYDAGLHAVNIDLGPSSTNGDAAILRGAGSQIQVNGSNCGAATVTNTDTINVTGTNNNHVVTINLSGGQFAPGFTTEATADSEIEFNVTIAGTGTHQLVVQGGAGNDVVRLGGNRIELNGAEPSPDADVIVNDLGGGKITVRGGLGNDKLSSQGGLGTPGGGVVFPYELDGEGGDDSVTTGAVSGGGQALSIHGGIGNDKMTNVATTGTISFFGDDGDDQLRAGSIAATFDGGNDKDLLIGSGLNDTLNGGAGPDNLQGRAGNDTLNGGADNDAIQPGLGTDSADGGSGIDTAGYQSEGGGVTVNLGTGQKTGSDPDTLLNFENVTGGAGNDNLTGTAGDNRMLGGLGNDTISGLAGADTILGGDGADNLSGGIGNDRISGGAGNDTVDGGPDNDNCDGGAGTDTLTNCNP
jgi:Ca2+-binding RTX toxin-like protein